MRSLRLDELVTFENFDEARYLAANPDVAAAVAAGHLASGLQHFHYYGRNEGRRARVTAGLDELRRAKMAKLEPMLRLDLPHVRVGTKLDFLTAALRAEAAIVETDNVSANPYAPPVNELIRRHPDGLLLDCGAGKRDFYYDTVVNYEIADYDSTDVLGIGEKLPFRDEAFDGVISMAVLEHVRDPFACAAEIARVLKPGGELICGVPFLQPLHGFPHHYYNMTGQGLRALFERLLVIDRQEVPPTGLPIWSLSWIIRSWAEGLDAKARDEFLNLQLKDLLRGPAAFLTSRWVSELPREKNMELASVTFIAAHKPHR